MVRLRSKPTRVAWTFWLALLLQSLQAPVVAAVALGSPEFLALAPPAQGLLVAQAADALDAGYEDLQVDLEMVLRGAKNRTTTRQLTIKQLEVADDGDKLLVVFSTPKAVKGTALLSFGHRQGPDDQWLYLPAIKRVKKINSKNRSGPFLSSEFSFEDLTPQEVDKFTYQLLRTAPCTQVAGDIQCYVLERVPLEKYTGYSRQEVWLDSQHLQIQKIDYFDRRGDLLKTLTASGYQLYRSRFWRAQKMVMRNHQNNKSTVLNWQQFRFATGLDPDRDFSANSLRRIR